MKNNYRKWKQWVSHFITFMLCVTFLGTTIGFSSYAYTDEEIQQAKAWLSAHGYSPDMGGASQAYQDYLNGKFDEELGLTSESQAAADTTQEETENTPAEAATTETTEEKDKTTQKDVPHEGNTAETDKEKQSTTESGTYTEYGTENAVSSKTGEQSEQEKQAEQTRGETEEVQRQGITLYKQEKSEDYQEAAMVVVFSVIFMLILVMILHIW